MGARRYEEIPGSGRVRVTSTKVLREAREARAEMLTRVEPLEGTNMTIFNSQIPQWWAENVNGTQMYGTPDLASRVWVANRCQQLCAQQIASMPLIFHGTDLPAWMTSPDPNIFPNGLSDAIFAIVDQLYGWGFSCQYVTDFYADGFPRTWTVLPSSTMSIKFVDGSRQYKIGELTLDPARVIQIDRNPTTAAHGTPALRAYAQSAWNLLAAGNQSMTVSQGGIPLTVLKSTRRLDAEQAQKVQTQWMEATMRRNGAPAVLPPELSFEVLSINPSDLALLETQEWNAKILADAYGVPAVMLNMALQGGLTYQNPMALMTMWWLTELRPGPAARLGNAFSQQMLPRGQWVSFDASDITLPLTSESTANDEQVANNALTPQRPQLAAIGGSG